MTYHERLKQRSPTAAELEEQKRRMSQGPTIEEIERRLQEAEQAALDASNYLGYPSGEVPVMGDEPPSPPENVIASPFFHQLDVSWSDPLEEDHVIRAFVRVRLAGDPLRERTVETPRYGGFVANLPAEPHTVEAAFEDRWGRVSEWSAPVEATPSLTVAESIDFTKAQIAGALGWDNLEPLTDPRNLGDDVVLARAMATQNLAATRLWAQVGAFESAMIKNLAVDKLMAGTFTAGQIMLAGSGALRAGRVKFDERGITMPTLIGFNPAPENLDYRIANGGEFASLHWFQQPGGPGQGLMFRADGNGGAWAGNLVLDATSNGNPSPSAGAANVQVRSQSPAWGGAHLWVRPKLVVEGEAVVEGNLRVDGRLTPDFIGEFGSASANGGALTWTHNLGVVPFIAIGQQILGNGQFKPLPVGGDAFGVFISWCTTTQVRIQNNEGVAWQVRPVLYK